MIQCTTNDTTKRFARMQATAGAGWDKQEPVWAGLTDEEVTLCHSLAVLSKKHDGTDPSFTTLLYRQIEAKPREKNAAPAQKETV